MRHGKKGWGPVLLMTVLAVAVTVLTFFLLYRVGEKDWVLQTEGEKVMALLLEGEPKGDLTLLPEEQRESWYASYRAFLLDRDLLSWEDCQGGEDKLLTFSVLYRFSESQGVPRKLLQGAVRGCGGDRDPVSQKVFWQWCLYLSGRIPSAGFEEKELTLFGSWDLGGGAKEWQAVCLEGTYSAKGLSLASYIDTKIKVLCKGTEILLRPEILSREVVYRNLWITRWDASGVTGFWNGVSRSFPGSKKDTYYQGVLADLTVKDQKLVRAELKKESLRCVLLEKGEGQLKLEGYGWVSLSSDCQVYRTYGTPAQRSLKELETGKEYSFIVAQGNICGVLMDDWEASDIRVLLHSADYGSLFHQKIVISCDTEFRVTAGDQETLYESGEAFSVEVGDELLSRGKILVEPVSYAGILQVPSAARRQGTPQYQGVLEISRGEEGLLLVNELPLEEYLCFVVPSEMPPSYGVEALKVQAVCARSYAVRQMEANALAQYGAHVDDSSSYQVYNNTQASPEAIQAVRETYGMVMGYGGQVITTYYYATSAGHTSDLSIWNSSPGAAPYLVGKGLGTETGDLTKEEVFRSYIKDWEYPSYDCFSGWYRWKVTVSAEELSKVVEKNLAAYGKENPTHVEVKGKDGSFRQGLTSVGTVTGLEITKRSTGGVGAELLITGTKGTVRLLRQGAIRSVLGCSDWKIQKKDGTTASKNLLPSAYITIEKEGDSFVIYGGGYGHGVGMSQTAVKTMIEEGMTAEEILLYFYEGAQVMKLY